MSIKTLVVYDTSYGNTSRIAEAIATGLEGDTAAIKVERLSPDQLAGVGLLVVESPTQGGRPTGSIQEWLRALPDQAIRAAAFDTRLRGGWLERAALDLVGYAAPHIADALRKKGCAVVDAPQGFVVSAGAGPLVASELERATVWGATLRAQIGPPPEPEMGTYNASNHS